MSRDRKSDQRFILPEVVDPPRKCLQIWIPDDVNHQRAFWASVMELCNAWAWEWDGSKTGSQAGLVWSEIVREASESFAFDDGGCFMFLLRQNPADSCQLQQSVDDGQTWTLVFDFGLCVSSESKTILTINMNLEINSIVQQYNDNSQDITLVFPNVEYDGSGGDTLRDQTLCWSIVTYVSLVCEAAISALSDQSIVIDAAVWVLNAVSDVADIVGSLIPGGNIMAWALSKITGAIIASLTASDIGALSNIDARLEVACCMVDNLGSPGTGNTVTFADWGSALVGCTLSGAEITIATAITATLTDLNSYLTFAQLWSQAITLQMAGAGLPCNCDISCWFFTFFNGTNLGVDNGDGTISAVFNSSFQAESRWRIQIQTRNWVSGVNEFDIGSLVSGSVSLVRVWADGDFGGGLVYSGSLAGAISISPIEGGSLDMYHSSAFTVNLSPSVEKCD